MAWYLLAHVLYRLHRALGVNEIDYTFLEEILRRIQTKYRVTLFADSAKLLENLEILNKFGAIEVNGRIIRLDPYVLRWVDEVLETDSTMWDAKRYHTAYLKIKLDKALNSVLSGSTQDVTRIQ